MSHLPVMLDEVVRALDPHDGGLYIDGTFGAGGYSRAILSAADCRLIGIDRDPSVIPAAEQLGKASGGRFVFVQAPFSKMAEVIRANGGETVDGIVLDIGVSSMQIDQAERGFSFMRAGPLDMRMARSGASAADAVNLLAEEELADIFYVYGDERRSRRIAKQIVEARAEAPIETTDRLAAIVTRATGGKHSKIHPATKVFQALRGRRGDSGAARTPRRGYLPFTGRPHGEGLLAGPHRAGRRGRLAPCACSGNRSCRQSQFLPAASQGDRRQ